MNKFFVPNEIYEDRITICKSCVYYFKPTGTYDILPSDEPSDFTGHIRKRWIERN